jgi:hypothetical protein
MSSITDNVRTALETYLLGDKEKALDMLIKGTKYHSYLTLIDHLKKDNAAEILKDDAKLRKLLEKYLKKESGEDVDVLMTHKLLLEYETADTDEKKKSALKSL